MAAFQMYLESHLIFLAVLFILDTPIACPAVASYAFLFARRGSLLFINFSVALRFWEVERPRLEGAGSDIVDNW